MPTANRPTFQVIVDAHGRPLTPELMRYLCHCVAIIAGSERIMSGFWITRDDIAAKYEEQGLLRAIPGHPGKRIGADRFHEPSADLYEEGKNVPIGRIVNLQIPE